MKNKILSIKELKLNYVICFAFVFGIMVLACTMQCYADNILEDGYYSITNCETNKYLSSDKREVSYTGKYKADTCKWQIYCSGYDDTDSKIKDTYEIGIGNKNYILHIYSNTTKQNVEVGLYPSYDQNNEIWKVVKAGDNKYYIESVIDKKYVLASKGNKTVIQKKNGKSNQKWKINKKQVNKLNTNPVNSEMTKITTGAYALVNASKPEYYLNTTEDGKIGLTKKLDKHNGLWRIRGLNAASDQFLIINYKNQRCLNVCRAKTDENTEVIFWGVSAKNNDLWSFVKVGNGNYYIQSKLNDQCVLALVDDKTVIQNKNGSIAQQWKIIDENSFIQKTEIKMFSTLTKKEAKVVKAIAAAVGNFKKTVNISSYKLKVSNLTQDDIYSNFIINYNELCFVRLRFIQKNGYYSEVKLEYEGGIDEAKRKSKELNKVIDKIIKGMDKNWSDFEKALYINQYLSANADYMKDVDDKANSYGLLVKGRGVCAGYAWAFITLAKRVGIETAYVSSRDINHGWVAVKLGKYYYHVDPTWCDCGDVTSNKNFMVSTAGIIENHHCNDLRIYNGDRKTLINTHNNRYDSTFTEYRNTNFVYAKGYWYAYNTSTQNIVQCKFDDNKIIVVKELCNVPNCKGDLKLKDDKITYTADDKTYSIKI